MGDQRLTLAMAFSARFGWNSVCSPLAGDASARRYFRLADGERRAVLMDADPTVGENVARFAQVATWLFACGYSAPALLAQDLELGFLLLEDLGDDLVARLVAADPAQEQPLYLATTRFLADLQRQPPPAFLARPGAHGLADLSSKIIDWYLPAVEQPPNDAALSVAPLFISLYDQYAAGAEAVSLRDLHAENLIWLPNRTGIARLGLLDFQDAFITHPAYDLVSLLQDARRDVSARTEQEAISLYLGLTGLEAGPFRTAYALIGTQRALRILAVFARLCLRAGKAQYLQFAPRVWRQMMRNLEQPELAALRDAIIAGIPEPTEENLQRIARKCSTRPEL